MQIEDGVRVGSFEVRAPLGAGGMGTVYRAHDPKLNRDVAIKILQDGLAGREEYLRRFEREARSASALNHPNIITIFEIDEFEGAPFIAMELVEGARLRDLLRQGSLPLRKLLNVATQIADGLAAAHDHGIVHRDVKPENVMITPHGLVKILDFGLARFVPDGNDESTAEFITNEHKGNVLGTAAYMSPEQAGGSSVDYRSDQFSFGSVLYEMATGRRAFARDSAAETFDAIIHDEPEPIQRANPRIPAPLCWIIERCLAKDPQDRYASTRDLARELQTVRDHLPETGSGERLVPRDGRAVRLATFAAVLVAVVGVGAYVVNSDRFRPAPPLLPGRQFLAILPFKDLSGRPDGQLFSQGFADAVSARLARFSIQVIPPASSAALVAKGADTTRIAQELGATLLVDASVQRTDDRLRISYTLLDSARGVVVAGDTVNGSLDDVWAVQDKVADAIARRLGAGQSKPETVGGQAELETAEEQDLYLRALGHLQNLQDEKALDSAVAILRELLETASDSPLIHAALSRAYLEKYNLTRDKAWSEKAVAAANRGRIIAPDSPEVLLALASGQRFTGRYDEAVSTFKRALALQPNSAEAAIGLAKSYQGAKNVAEAEQSFRRGISLRPTWWSGHNELGVLYLTTGRYDEAGREFARVIKLNPQNAWGYSNAGAVHIFKEELSEAIAVFTKAIALGADSAATYSNLAYCYYYLGRYDKSVESARKAVDLQPKLATNWVNLADACRWTPQCRGEVDAVTRRAITLLREDLAVNPKNARAHGTLAAILARIGERSEADHHIGQALDLEPKNPTRMYQAARVANFSGDTPGALSWLRRAISAGHSEFELQRDPEFRELRETKAFRNAFKKNPQTA